MIKAFSDYSFNGAPVFVSGGSVNISSIDTNSFAPIGYAHGHAIYLYKTICSFISPLLVTGRPLAIIRRIALAIVFSLDRELRGWSRPHVLQKRLKTITPSVANCDSSFSIIFIPIINWTMTAIDHSCPNNVFRSARESMCSLPRRALLTTEASAADCITTSKVGCGAYISLSAIADTSPHDIFVSRGQSTQNKKAPEPLTFKIKCSWHNLIRGMTAYNSKLGNRSMALGVL